jgi:lipopolysaccharide export LptBFGC system permease protein LptF
MVNPLDYPYLILLASLFVFWFSAWIGGWFHARQGSMGRDRHEDLAFVLGGTLTLLGLIIGFTFSMTINRYDQRKNLEEEEANAIGTEYLRADLLSAADASRVHILLRLYLDQRILWYKSRSNSKLRQINVETGRLQNEMWSVVAPPAVDKPTSVAALTVAGMNDVLNSQGYTQASWWNRIPVGAWILLAAIFIFCNILVGYVAHDRGSFLFSILPVALSISLFLIADIDSPRRGIIRTYPQNLESVAASLPPQ